MSSADIERIKALEDYFYNREMSLQDASLSSREKKLLEDRPVRFAGSDLGVDPRAEEAVIKSSVMDKVRQLLGENRPVPVRNVYLGDKTAEEYGEPDQEVASPNLIPLLRKLGHRIGKFGEQYVDNVPGLSSMGTVSGDDADSAAGAAIQAGGRYFPILGAAWYGLNAGPTAAGTLEEARAKGLIR